MGSYVLPDTPISGPALFATESQIHTEESVDMNYVNELGRTETIQTVQEKVEVETQAKLYESANGQKELRDHCYREIAKIDQKLVDLNQQLLDKKKVELYDVVKTENKNRELNDESFRKVKKILQKKQTLQKRMGE